MIILDTNVFSALMGRVPDEHPGVPVRLRVDADDRLAGEVLRHVGDQPVRPDGHQLVGV